MNHTQKIAFGDASFLKSDAKEHIFWGTGDASFLKSDAKEHIFWGTDKKHPNLGTPLNTVYKLSMIIPKISYYNYASYSHKHKKEAPISGNLQLDRNDSLHAIYYGLFFIDLPLITSFMSLYDLYRTD